MENLEKLKEKYKNKETEGVEETLNIGDVPKKILRKMVIKDPETGMTFEVVQTEK